MRFTEATLLEVTKPTRKQMKDAFYLKSRRRIVDDIMSRQDTGYYFIVKAMCHKDVISKLKKFGFKISESVDGTVRFYW